MWFGRFAMIVPVLAIAGSLAAKKRLPVTAGTLPTHGPLFVSLLIGTVLLVGLLNYVPALALGLALGRGARRDDLHQDLRPREWRRPTPRTRTVGGGASLAPRGGRTD